MPFSLCLLPYNLKPCLKPYTLYFTPYLNPSRMITRIVKMHFSSEFSEEFKLIFKATQPLISGFEGCMGVELFMDEADRDTFFTISKWQSTVLLNHYRNSVLFKETWAKVKPKFVSKAEAWSLIDC